MLFYIFMWEFPSIQAFIATNIILFLWVLGVFAVSAITWIFIIYSIKRNKKDTTSEFLKNILIGSISFLLVFFVSYSLVSNFNEVRKCRNLDLTKVESIRIKKVANEKSLGESPILISDSDKIRNGLETLQNANGRQRNRENFVNGYQIQLILENTAETIYLYYFSENERGIKKDIVIPRCETGYNDYDFDYNGIYSAPAFGNWIREELKPELDKIR